MADVTAAMVKELRDRTALSYADCRKALIETGGDMERAIEELRKSSALKAAKKADRTATEGLLGVMIAPDGRAGAMVEVNIETDFAAKNPEFNAFVQRVLTVAFERREQDPASLLSGPLGADREALVQSIGENVTVRRAVVLAPPGGVVSGYLHTDRRKGALVALEGGDAELARDLAMHVTASSPLVVESKDVSSEVIEKEREIFRAQAAESGKPPEIVEKMVDGRVRKFLAEVSLVDQPFVKDPEKKVGQLLAARRARCLGFSRFEVGEGIAKETKDFAAEVSATVAQTTQQTKSRR